MLPLKFCGSLNVVGPQKLLGSGTIRKCGFVGEGMVLEEVSHCEWGEALRFPILKIPQCLSQLPAVCEMQGSQLQRHIFLCTAMLPVMVIRDGTSKTVSKLP